MTFLQALSAVSMVLAVFAIPSAAIIGGIYVLFHYSGIENAVLGVTLSFLWAALVITISVWVCSNLAWFQ